MSRPDHINPVEWELALSMARAICASLFKQGGTAEEALKLYDAPYGRGHGGLANWQTAIEAIAYAHCHQVNCNQVTARAA